MIYATGYAPASAVDFLPEDVKQELHYDSSSDRLPIILSGWQTMVESVPDLAILGFYEGPFWPIVEMQARLTADRWLSKRSVTRRPYEETEKLLDLRKAMHERAFDVPQYWFVCNTNHSTAVSAGVQLTYALGSETTPVSWRRWRRISNFVATTDLSASVRVSSHQHATCPPTQM